jgi:hypothetical protein
MWNETGNVCITLHRGAFVLTLLLWKSSECYTTRVCLFVAFCAQHAMLVRHIVICVLPGSPTFLFVQYLIKDTFLLSDLNDTWIFPAVFRIIVKYHIYRKSAQWEPNCSVRTDGQTDMTKLILAFRNFAIAPENEYVLRSINWQIGCCVFRYRRWSYLCQIGVAYCTNVPSECCLKATVERSSVRIRELSKTRKQAVLTYWISLY